MPDVSDFVETICELRVLKGFPRGDSKALYIIAEHAMKACLTVDRAREAVGRIVATAPEWRGPVQFYEALQTAAPEEWEPLPGYFAGSFGAECGRCNDTGAVEVADGFEVCSCDAGRDAAAHVEGLNRIRRDMVSIREKARETCSHQPMAKPPHEVVRELSIVLGVDA